MNIKISTSQGVIETNDGNSITVDGVDFYESMFVNKYDDIHAEIIEGTGPSALTFEEYRDTEFFMKFFRHNQNDKLFLNFHIPHNADYYADVRPHLHYIPMASGSGIVNLNFIYSWSNLSGTIGAASSWSTGSIQISCTPDNQYKQYLALGPTIQQPTGSNIGTMLFYKVQRITDTYTASKDHGTAAANLALLSFDLHYRLARAGSSSELHNA